MHKFSLTYFPFEFQQYLSISSYSPTDIGWLIALWDLISHSIVPLALFPPKKLWFFWDIFSVNLKNFLIPNIKALKNKQIV